MAVGRLRHQMAAAQFGEVFNPVAPQRIASSRAAQLTDDGQHRAGLRPGAQHRGTTVKVTNRGDRHHPLPAADQIAADDAGTNAPRLLPHSVDQRARLRRRRLSGCSKADHERGGPRPHRLDVGGILGDRLAADVLRCRPVQPEVTILHQHVRRHHSATIAGRHQRGIVAGPEQYRGGLSAPPHQPVDHGELAELLQRRGLRCK
ncbi:Uncharacterised protein [Mycobacterium tuberculosis]|nr:Uncharacterised protein [Mycobacterium tuberculosis]